jgi:hypothetical protein
MMMGSLSSKSERKRKAVFSFFVLHPPSFFLALLFCLACPVSRAAETSGPTIHLNTDPNPVADFMYFVPLISPQPMASLSSLGGAQSVRILSTKRHLASHAFTLTCEAELTGDGWQRSVFDLAASIHRHEAQLENGCPMVRLLKSIEVKGAGEITMDVEGSLSNGLAVVKEVRLHFNAHGNASPVWLDLCEIRRLNGEAKIGNEILARVNTLTFRRQTGPPTMEVSLASIKHKEAGNGFWQNLRGRIAGAAANMFLDPLTVEAAGHQAMLDFGLALISDSPTFTFPLARNLQANSAP